MQGAQAELDLLTAGSASEAIAAAQATVAAAAATLQRAQADLANSQLRAPFAGTVTAIDINPGEMVQAGQVVVTIADLSRMQVETTDLSERDVVQVAVAQPVVVFVKALNKEIPGKVVRVASQSTLIGGDVVYTVTISLDQQPPGLRWGMSVDVQITAS